MDIKPQPQQPITPPEADLSAIEPSDANTGQYSESIINTPAVEPKQKRSPKKFLLVLLVVLLVVASGAGGWVYGKSQQKKSSDSEAATLNSKIADLKKEKASLQSQLAAAQKGAKTSQDTYLTIKEWGVKMKLTSDIKDAIYTVKGDTLSISTTTLAKMDKLCDPMQTVTVDGQAGGVTRILRDDPAKMVNEKPVKEFFPIGVTVGSKYIYYTGSQSPCTGDNAANNKIETATMTSISNAVKTIQSL